MKFNLTGFKPAFWFDPDKRAILYQIFTFVMVGLLAYYLISNTMQNLEKQNIASGFDFLKTEAGFEIGESPIPYDASNSYARALFAGALNTLKVSVTGIILSLIIGIGIGIARLSKNWLLAKLALVYIEVMQNIPILLQLFFWYALFFEGFPAPQDAFNPIDGLFICNRGIAMAVPAAHASHPYIFAAVIIGIIASVCLKKWARYRQEKTGKEFRILPASICLVIGMPLLTWIFAGAPTSMEMPVLKGFNFSGGLIISPEFLALLIGLVIYTSAFVAEAVRAGIQAVSSGQTEAALSLGLKKRHILNLVLLPQALRIIIPPLTSQMLNLTKNSSLAIAIGFPDFVSVANTTINITGQSIEGVALIMGCYLIFSLSTSVFMNWYNKKTQLVER